MCSYFQPIGTCLWHLLKLSFGRSGTHRTVYVKVLLLGTQKVPSNSNKDINHHLIFMKRKPLNKSRFTYLKQNTPLNVVPEKKLKRADLVGLIENRGKSRFRTKRLRERVESLIRSDLVFKNKTNAKPLTLVRTTSNLLLLPQARNSFKAREPFHLNMNAKRTVHLLAVGSTSVGNAKQQLSCSGFSLGLATILFSKSCLIKTLGCTLKSNTCTNQILERNKSINTPLCKAIVGL